jgi:phosphate starvation-inducible PhoH-like protein
LNENLVSELCGVNDQNLKLFSELLGVDVHFRGNEIYLNTENRAIWQKFKKLVSYLEEHVNNGCQASPDLLRALYLSMEDEEENVDLLSRTYIHIPKTQKKVFPKSYNQALYIKCIENYDIVFGIGPAGTGKTYLAVAYAAKSLLSHKTRKLILTRPVVEAGENLGFLPGDLQQKISPYLRPLYDALEDILSQDIVHELYESGKIEIAPLAYMRGRTLSNCFVILDEAQNSTREQMKMFLTRIGTNSKTVVTGDITQIDLPKSSASGLLHIIPILKNIDEIQFLFFNEHDVVRNPLVKKIVQAYEDNK